MGFIHSRKWKSHREGEEEEELNFTFFFLLISSRILAQTHRPFRLPPPKPVRHLHPSIREPGLHRVPVDALVPRVAVRGRLLVVAHPRQRQHRRVKLALQILPHVVDAVLIVESVHVGHGALGAGLVGELGIFGRLVLRRCRRGRYVSGAGVGAGGVAEARVGLWV